jgi:hypothetical protein
LKKSIKLSKPQNWKRKINKFERERKKNPCSATKKPSTIILMKIIEKKSSYPKKKKKKKNTSCRFFIIGNFNIFSHLKKISINIFLVVVSSFYTHICGVFEVSCIYFILFYVLA